MRPRTITDLISGISALVIITAVFITGVYFAFNGYIEFDEGIFLQVPENLYLHQVYATGYDGGRLYDHLLTTGPTVLLPITGAYLLTSSTSVEIARLVIVLFLLATFICAWLVSRSLFGNLAGVLAILLFASLPFLENFGVAVLGEIPAVFFSLIGIYFLSRNKRALACLFIGLAALTKFVFLIAVAALLITFILNDLLLKKTSSSRWKSLPSLLVSAGIAISPYFLWEFNKFLALGWTGYKQNIQDFIWLFITTSTSKQSDLIAKLIVNINTLATPFQSISGGVVLLFLIVSFCWILAKLYREYHGSGLNSQSLSKLFLVIFSAAYLIWWIFANGTGWWRHLMPGMMLMLVPFCGFVADMLKLALARLRTAIQTKARFNLLMAIMVAIPTVALVIFSVLQPVGNQITNISQHVTGYPAAKKVQLQVAGLISDLANQGAKIGGWGWWQSPEISILAGQNFVDLGRGEARKIADDNLTQNIPVYLLLSPIQTREAPSVWDEEKAYAGEKIFDIYGYQLFRYIAQDDINAQIKYLNLRGELSSFTTVIDFSASRYQSEQLIEGIYQDGWVARDASVWLKKSPDQKYLFVNGSAPLGFFQNQPVTVKIFVMNSLISEQVAIQPGDFSWEIPLPLPTIDQLVIKITLQADRSFIPSKLGITPDGRELSFSIKQIGLR